MKKKILLPFVLSCLALASCGKGKNNDNEDKDVSSKVVETSTSTTTNTQTSTSQVESYVVNFETNGGSNINSVSVVSGNKVEKPNNPSRKGYDFLGWYKDSELKNIFDFENEIISSPTTIYASWDALDVTIEFVNVSPSDVSGNVNSISLSFGQDFNMPYGNYESLNYTFKGWTKTNYNLGVDNPTVDYNAGANIDVDDLASIYNNGKIILYAVFEKNEYTYTVTKVDSTLTSDGYIQYTCNEDSSKSYIEILHKEDVFYARPIDTSLIDQAGTMIKVEVEQGIVKVGDKISIALYDGTVLDDIEVLAMNKNGGYVSSASEGDIVGMLVGNKVDRNKVLLTNGLVCENKKALSSKELYIMVEILDSINISYLEPGYEFDLSLSGEGNQSVVIKNIYYINYEECNQAYKGGTYLFKVMVSDSDDIIYAWRGIEGALFSGTSMYAFVETLGNNRYEFENVSMKVYLNNGTDDYYNIIADKDATFAELAKPSRNGYKFVGFINDPSITDKSLIDNFNNNEIVAYYYDKGVYAVWEKEE